MRYIRISSLTFAASLLLVGCEKSTSSTKPSDQKFTNAKEKIGEAADATAAATKAKRDDYARDMEKKLDEFDAKYQALEKRAAEAKGDAKKDLDEKVKVAKAKREVAANKLSELKEASADRWEKVKDGVGSALDDLKKVIE
jgi:hypothetical protein